MGLLIQGSCERISVADQPQCRSSGKERVILKWPHDYYQLSAVLAEVRRVEAGVCRGGPMGEKVLKNLESWPQTEVHGMMSTAWWDSTEGLCIGKG